MPLKHVIVIVAGFPDALDATIGDPVLFTKNENWNVDVVTYTLYPGPLMGYDGLVLMNPEYST
jgi:hypothetical protein